MPSSATFEKKLTCTTHHHIAPLDIVSLVGSYLTVLHIWIDHSNFYGFPSLAETIFGGQFLLIYLISNP
ncbi:hypothetical protein B0F90DRAFT_207642 [Multifurca ochricompacta]|uniref:Uncharacterized protein n=1 Tax=Multifurca ochricompacta TaxID=376703 RepID=A0AAD4QMY0_9AGAM|nr:hypothetical protein B0F90DRAFT_207642 [Multifurca ochricompacta]